MLLGSGPTAARLNFLFSFLLSLLSPPPPPPPPPYFQEYSTYSDSRGGGCLGKLINRNYVDANLTALIVWDMTWAWYDGLACSGQGLIWAGEPWSGAIGIVDTVWAVAHTTQVADKGWRLRLGTKLRVRRGVRGRLPPGGDQRAADSAPGRTTVPNPGPLPCERVWGGVQWTERESGGHCGRMCHRMLQ